MLEKQQLALGCVDREVTLVDNESMSGSNGSPIDCLSYIDCCLKHRHLSMSRQGEQCEDWN